MKYPRAIAVQVLSRVIVDGEMLDSALARSGVPAESRAWLTDVCSGVLRWKGRIDLAIDAGAEKKKPSGRLRRALELAVYQLIAQDRAPFTEVVSETVSYIKSSDGVPPSRFANALLRKITEHRETWKNLEWQTTFNEEEAARWASLPLWLWKKLLKDRGLEWTKAYAMASLQRPSFWLHEKDQSDPRTWEAGVSLLDLPGFQAGTVIVQDISSQKLVKEVAKLVPENSAAAPRAALDLCAAPGGKAIGLQWQGFSVTAADVSEDRLALLRENFARTKLPARVCLSSDLETEARFDLVWVDAPCSSTGVLRKHPDVRFCRKPETLPSLGQLQSDLADRGWHHTAVGGTMVYSVCSLLKEEGENRLRTHLAKWGVREEQIQQQWLIAPQDAPYGDGFYAIAIQKV